MDIFAINISVSTAERDKYDKVALNVRPMIIKSTRNKLEETLKTPQVVTHVKNLIHSKTIFEGAEFQIVQISASGVEHFVLPVKNCIELTFD